MKTIYYYLLAGVILTTSGCSSWLSEDDAPIMSYDYYETEQGVDAAITAAYGFLRWGVGGERFDVLTEHGTDLFTEGEDGSYRESYNKYATQLNPDEGILYSMWENHYKGISDANIAMQKILDSDLQENIKNKGYAEMQFIRAFLYFDLVQQFGRIPLVTEGSFEIRTDFKRTAIPEIYNQIISDLRNSVEYLPEKASNAGRATCFSASHLLSKVYLTRGSAVTEDRGQKSTDIDSTLFYAEKVINSGYYKLQENFSSLWDIKNQGNSENIFAIQFTISPIYNGDGNKQHLYWLSWYEDQAGMLRDIENGRPFRRHVATKKTMENLYDRLNDSRFYKSFKWVYFANNAKTLPKWEQLSFDGTVYFTPDPSKGQVQGKQKFDLGDTAIYYTMQKVGLETNTNEMRKLRANYKYAYFPRETHSIRYFPSLIKYLDPSRPSVSEEKGSREWVRMRLGETYLIAAEAAGRKNDFDKAAQYINVVRKRAAWANGEQKDQQIWMFEGGKNDTESTYDKLMVTPANLSNDFISFILDERGRELLGETNRWEDLVRCELLYDWVKKHNPDAIFIKPYHKLRPIPQKHIDRLSPAGEISEEQNEGYY
ncbi:RagB/SusD family nutrient uptake outer membrane protein [Massilibacteroides vaginae]|uniref:RagB/SusD family nutrient uptake outer membrane protein n=1 Tax=Massilibacteroides vaginae TaxID=1673718 RepID=UPI000A1CF1F1|nr:RagB/SusD family nutrient uptake outer membrane protein [Massilibacteroides vaginae]